MNIRIVTTSILLACVGVVVYGYIALHHTYLPFSNNIKSAETVIRQKIEQWGKELSLPGPLWGDTSESSVTLTLSGIFEETNIARLAHSEEVSLLRNTTLDQIALHRIDDMFQKQYFEHISPTGESASDEAVVVGYNYISIGENIALGNFESDAALVEAWMESPGHRENILSPKYTEIGIGAKKGMYDGNEVWIAVQIFGRPLSDCNEPSLILKKNIETQQTYTESLKNQADILYTKLSTPGKSPDEYNAQVAEYNALVKKVNEAIAETKRLISQYNSQVNSFNSCIEQ